MNHSALQRSQEPVVALSYDETQRPRERRQRPVLASPVAGELATASTRASIAATASASFPHASSASIVDRSSPPQEAYGRQRAARCRLSDPLFAHWAAGYGMIRHEDATQVRVFDLAQRLVEHGSVPDTATVFRLFAAADRVCSSGMWLVVHQTYASRVYLDGRPLQREDFKPRPEGHTGGSLNMVPGYAGYLLANALSGVTRSWIMGPGHCVSAIDSLNVLVGNLNAAQAERYAVNDRQLTTFVEDFYSYRCAADGSVAVPMGSHVSAHTAGGISEGGYLGFAELQYVHMPLPGERLVAFLSDGAFEEQRGSDWAPRWWRAEDCGLVMPILLANGRRIDQRSAIYQNGGMDWLKQHLTVNQFDPIGIDGRDPAAFAWAIIDMEERLGLWSAAIANGEAQYPVPMPYAIAEAPKGFGFPGQATNDAHNLPLGANPFEDVEARRRFNTGAHHLHVSSSDLTDAVAVLNNHARSGRVREKDHALAKRLVVPPTMPEPRWSPIPPESPAAGTATASDAPVPVRTGLSRAAHSLTAPMVALDIHLADILVANPQLRPRIGNPDEMRSNRLNRTLDLLKHRVSHPEPGMAESIHGGVITALNEEAVACAALGNKGGINLVASYEAFGVKMLGAFRQELIFARHQKELGIEPGWLSVPMVLTSHTWENGKNEQSHQDPTFCEAMLAEMNDVSRVVFAADANHAVAGLRQAYRTHGQIWTMVVPKNPLPDLLTPDQAQRVVMEGGIRLHGTGTEPIQIMAIGGYQLVEAVRASDRLTQRGMPHQVVYLAEPGRFRASRDHHEAAAMADVSLRRDLFAASVEARLVLTHTRPEAIAGLLENPCRRSAMLGYRNRGGTLDVAGMLFANQCTWAHALTRLAQLIDVPSGRMLSEAEMAAVEGRGDPRLLSAPGERTTAASAR